MVGDVLAYLRIHQSSFSLKVMYVRLQIRIY
jgi:hypothetical protein